MKTPTLRPPWRYFLPLIVILMISPLQAQSAAQPTLETPAAPAVIPGEFFLQPRSGARLTRHPELRRAALDWIEGRSQRLTIRYPGGEEGVLWARELRDWLVALGIASAHIELLPGTPEADALVIEPW